MKTVLVNGDWYHLHPMNMNVIHWQHGSVPDLQLDYQQTINLQLECKNLLECAVLVKIIFTCMRAKRLKMLEVVPRERMRSTQPTINYSVNIPTWSSFTQRRRLSARRAARIAG